MKIEFRDKRLALIQTERACRNKTSDRRHQVLPRKIDSARCRT